MKHSGRVILLDNEQVLLIKRVKTDREYYVFPGGKGEIGETPEETAIREAYEELGVQVELGRCFAEVVFHEVKQYYFLAAMTSGELGTGTADEFTTGEGTYELLWINIAELADYPVIPEEVAKKLVKLNGACK